MVYIIIPMGTWTLELHVRILGMILFTLAILGTSTLQKILSFNLFNTSVFRFNADTLKFYGTN